MNNMYWLLVCVGVTISLYSIVQLPEWLAKLQVFLERKIESLQDDIQTMFEERKNTVIKNARAAIIRQARVQYPVVRRLAKESLTNVQVWEECLAEAYSSLVTFVDKELNDSDAIELFYAAKESINPYNWTVVEMNESFAHCPDADKLDVRPFVKPEVYNVEEAGL